jgi:hypothetical protein
MESEHKGHEIEVGVYGPGLEKNDQLLLDISSIHNLSLECLDCSTVIVDYDIDDEMTVAKARNLISEAIKEIL